VPPRVGGAVIDSPEALAAWAEATNQTPDAEGRIAATFVGRRRSASPRRPTSEHVACRGRCRAGRWRDVLHPRRRVACRGREQPLTGYCPEPTCCPGRGGADRIPLPHPGRFTTEVVFRRCLTCASGTWSATAGSSAPSVGRICRPCNFRSPCVSRNPRSATPTQDGDSGWRKRPLIEITRKVLGESAVCFVSAVRLLLGLILHAGPDGLFARAEFRRDGRVSLASLLAFRGRSPLPGRSR
jgi:hypothetical protein